MDLNQVLQERRQKILRLPRVYVRSLIMDNLFGLNNQYEIKYTADVPQDVHLLAIRFDDVTDSFFLFIAHSSFESVPQTYELPIIRIKEIGVKNRSDETRSSE